MDKTGTRVKKKDLDVFDILGVCVDVVSGCIYISGWSTTSHGKIIKLNSNYNVLTSGLLLIIESRIIISKQVKNLLRVLATAHHLEITAH